MNDISSLSKDNIQKIVKQKIKNKPLTIVGDGKQSRDFVHVTDVVKAFLAAAKTNNVGKKEVERSAKFVRRNIQLLTKLGFEDIDGGREDFKIGGVRIDVCAGAEGTLLIMEAKSAEKKTEVDLRDLLRKTIGVKQLFLI